MPISAQQQRLFGSGDQSRIAAVKRKLQLDCENKISNQDQSPIKKLKENGCQVLNNLNEKNTPVTPKISTLLAQRKQMLNNIAASGSRQATPYPAPIVSKRLNGRNVRVITSPKMKAKKQIINDENVINGSTPVKIIKTSAQKNPEDQTVQETIKSPLRAVHNKVLSPINSPVLDNSMKTPKNENLKNKISIKSSAKKSSLLRRLMASATPGKSQSPRKLDRAGPSNNITMTTYKKPQDCLDHLTRSLNAKGVECKQKEYVHNKRQKTFILAKNNWKRLTFLIRNNNGKRKLYEDVRDFRKEGKVY